MWSDLDDRTMNKSLIQSFLHYRMSLMVRSGGSTHLIQYVLLYLTVQTSACSTLTGGVFTCTESVCWLTTSSNEWTPDLHQNHQNLRISLELQTDVNGTPERASNHRRVIYSQRTGWISLETDLNTSEENVSHKRCETSTCLNLFRRNKQPTPDENTFQNKSTPARYNQHKANKLACTKFCQLSCSEVCSGSQITEFIITCDRKWTCGCFSCFYLWRLFSPHWRFDWQLIWEDKPALQPATANVGLC